MPFIPTEIPEIIVIEPKLNGDDRGFFMETYRESDFLKAGISAHFVQDNHSGSRQGILRGLHYQIQHPQGKLLRVVVGEIFDVVVDLRKSSPTLGKWTGVNLSAQNKKQIWVPTGFAHGFYVVSEWAEVVYKTTDYYAPEFERSLLWNDPEIDVRWPIQAGMLPLLSAKDAIGKPFAETELFD